ncbi:ROK family protein [Gaoshiqia sp. Z1-71]|uniref:ROK family protein n=1 Tax=Gaoshiqia hydrogeniformans TaxID=3290090 RepID=UPI003BF8EC6E
MHTRKDPINMAIGELKRHRLRAQVLRLLYTKGDQSATILSKKTSVSLPTVRAILDELIERKIVFASGIGDSQGGRKPALYKLRDDAFFILAVEFGHYKAKASLFNCHNQPICSIHEFDTHIDDPQLEDKLAAVFEKLLAEASLQTDKINAIGLSMPGLIDSENGINRTIKDEASRDVVSRLTKRFKIKTYLGNDARAQALGELVFGEARNTQNTTVINWSWGLGLGLILNGQIYRGSNGSAGELSHIRVVENGDLCDCGKRGCLQTIAGARKLLNMAGDEVNKGTISRLTSRFSANPQDIQPADIIYFAKQGDELCISLLNRISKNLAWGLSILIQLYNPELIVLNGPLSEAGQYILIPIQQTLNQYCLENICMNVKVRISDAGDTIGLKGVAVMVFQNIFHDKSAHL